MLRRFLAVLAVAATSGCAALTAGGTPTGDATPVPHPPSTPGTSSASGTPSTSGVPGHQPSSATPTPATAAAAWSSPPPTARPAAPAPAVWPAGAVVVLDPGHNGANAAYPEVINRQVPAGFGQHKPCNTTGTATASGYPEHAFTFDVAQRVGRILAERGVRVLATRSSDTGVGPCVNDRAAFGNRHQAAAVVSIHADGHVGGHGFHVIEAARPPAGAATAAASHRLAVAVHDRYAAESGFAPSTYVGSDGYDPRTDLAGLNLSTRPAVFLECGNMRDPDDAGRMTSTAGRQQVARAIADGILAFLATR